MLNNLDKYGYVNAINAPNFTTIQIKHHSVYVIAKNNVVFTDAVGHWDEEFVSNAANRGLVVGTGNNQFNPDKTVTRAEFVQMIVNALDLPKYDGISPRYRDVNDEWFVEAVMTAQTAGFLDKIADISQGFMPNQPILREEMAYIIACVISYEKIDDFIQISNVTSKFSDASEINAKYKTSVQKVFDLEIMNGISVAKFDPKGETTRAQAATVLINMLKSFAVIEAVS